MNPNPRVGVLLGLYGGSERLRLLLWPYRRRGLRWLERHVPGVWVDGELRRWLAKRKVKSC